MPECESVIAAPVAAAGAASDQLLIEQRAMLRALREGVLAGALAAPPCTRGSALSSARSSASSPRLPLHRCGQRAKLLHGSASLRTEAPRSVFARFSKFARTTTEDLGLVQSSAAPKSVEDEDDDDDDYVDMFNDDTGEWNGPRNGEPTRYGDWYVPFLQNSGELFEGETINAFVCFRRTPGHKRAAAQTSSSDAVSSIPSAALLLNFPHPKRG